MKTFILSVLYVFTCIIASAQCSNVGVQISSSDTGYVQLYHAGFFLIPSGSANVVIWEVTDFSGNAIHQDTTSGSWSDQSFSLFNHAVPISDSMRATIEITNSVEGIVCFMEDTIFWEETMVLPGSFVGSWAVLNNAGGVIVTGISNEVDGKPSTRLYPSPVQEEFAIIGAQDVYMLRLVDLNGKLLETFMNVRVQEPVNISHIQSGMYLVHVMDSAGELEVHRIVKL